MRRRGLSKQKRLRLTLASSLFVVLSIPLAIFALLNTESFDPTSDASEDLTTSISCNFEFIYVNPGSIEAGSNVQLEVRGRVFEVDEVITNLSITDVDGQAILKKDYTEQITSLTETFIYSSPTSPDTTVILGTLTSNQSTYPCTLYDAEDNSITTLQTNLAPEFQTDPYTSSVPAATFDVNTSYSYKLIARDTEQDDIEYSYSFTPGADWLGMSVVKNGADGELELDFAGTPTVPESYLANVFIHDGYTQHLRSQSWVISVEQGENDIPVVTITEPIPGTSITQGTILRISWSATDLNQIVQYRLYYASNPGNQSSWVPINESVSYDVGNYLFDTAAVPTGSYRIIVQAVDNQSPAGVGVAISEAFGINERPVTPTDPTDPDPDPGSGDDDPEPDDGVRLEDPQIINISPESGSEVSNKRRTISATLVASKDAEINLDSIKFTFDEVDLTDQIEISEISEYEATVIFKPEEDMSEGEHKVTVSFEDTKEKEADRTWTFTVISEDEGDKDSYNIWGYEIPKRTALIIVAGIVILLLALLIPWLLYLAWRNSDDDYDIYATNTYGGDSGNGGGTTYNSYSTTPAKASTTVTEKTSTSQTSTDNTSTIRTPILHTKTETKTITTPPPTAIATTPVPMATTPTSTTTTQTSTTGRIISPTVPTYKPVTPVSNSRTDYKYPTVGNNSPIVDSKTPAPSGTIVNNIPAPQPSQTFLTPPLSQGEGVKAVQQKPVQPVTIVNNPPQQVSTPVTVVNTPPKAESKTPVTNVTNNSPIAYPPKAAVNLTEAKPKIEDDRKDEITALAERLKKESQESNQLYTNKTTTESTVSTTKIATPVQQNPQPRPAQQAPQPRPVQPAQQPVPRIVPSQPLVNPQQPVVQQRPVLTPPLSQGEGVQTVPQRPVVQQQPSQQQPNQQSNGLSKSALRTNAPVGATNGPTNQTFSN